MSKKPEELFNHCKAKKKYTSRELQDENFDRLPKKISYISRLPKKLSNILYNSRQVHNKMYTLQT